MTRIDRGMLDRLAQAAKDGDEKPLRDLVEAAYPLVRRWTLAMTGDPNEADDVTQEVLIRMVRRIGAFRGESRFETWLYSAARNAVTDRRRRERRQARFSEDEWSWDALQPVAPVDPLQAAERNELRAALRSWVEDLPARQRQIFDLVELQGRSSTEVAELLGIAPASVRANLFKARRTIRTRVLAEQPDIVEGSS